MSKPSKAINPLFFVLMLLPMIGTAVCIWFFGGLNMQNDLLLGALLGMSSFWILLCCRYIHKRACLQNSHYEALLDVSDNISVPLALFDDQGQIVLQNQAFKGLQPNEETLKKLWDLPPNEHCIRMIFANSVYDAYIEKSPDSLYYLAVLQQIGLSPKQANLELRLPTIAYIQIDNYDEIADRSTSDRSILNNALAHTEHFIIDAGGVARSYERGKLLAIIDRATLQRMRDQKFPVLDTVREYKISNGSSVTLSIAVGAEATLRESMHSSQDALALTLGRGGDQAVVRENGKYYFYGGKLSEGEHYSRVKSRVFANSLSTLMVQYDNVFVMGHKMADMDALGAALGMACTAKAQKKPVYMVLEQNNPMIDSFLSAFMQTSEAKNLFMKPDQAQRLCNKRSLVIVVDTQRAVATAAPELLKNAGAIVMMDHHVRGIDGNIEATLLFTEPHASSTCELVCEVLQYFKPEVHVSSLTASGMLCGIIVDTKNFSKNSSARTFEAAAYLRQHHAKSSFVRQVFMETMDDYLGRAEIVSRAEKVTEDIVIAICPTQIPNAGLLSAKAADDLINIKGIEAAFVLFESEKNVINISARSSEDVNVQLILEGLGGGGHYNASGARLNVKMEQATEQVKEAILRYAKENNRLRKELLS